jgi:hypothetical protein
MSYVIKLLGFANTGQLFDQPLYVRHYQPAPMDAHGKYLVEGWLECTTELSRAKHFSSLHSAWSEWRLSNGKRPDGKPNRPLTGYHIELCRVVDA